MLVGREVQRIFDLRVGAFGDAELAGADVVVEAQGGPAARGRLKGVGGFIARRRRVLFE